MAYQRIPRNRRGSLAAIASMPLTGLVDLSKRKIQPDARVRIVRVQCEGPGAPAAPP